MTDDLINRDIKVTKLVVWKMMAGRQNVQRLANMITPETYEQVQQFFRELSREFTEVESRAFSELNTDEPESDIESVLRKSPNEALLREIISGNDYARLIWDQIKPSESDE